MIYALLLPDWLREEQPELRPLHGEFTESEIIELNTFGYNVYFYPNFPSICAEPNKWLDGKDIDVFHTVFVDMDLKDGKHESKESFLQLLLDYPLTPTTIIDSGNGIHAYWSVTDLTCLSFLKLNRRLCRFFNTDPAVTKIKQLMRLPGTVNTKKRDEPKLCTSLYEGGTEYTCEQLDASLPPILQEDEDFCKDHFARTYSDEKKETTVDEKIPLKFADLLRQNTEVQKIWSGGLDDRSGGDFRLGHIMFASGFTKEEAASVLVNGPKARDRAPKHRIKYATDIVDKVGFFDLTTEKPPTLLSRSVRDIMTRPITTANGSRFACWRHFDATLHGFRLGQVIGLVAGSGVGKTSMALNMFMGFVENNPDYDHFFVPLEQPVEEIAARWKTICNGRETLYDKVQIISNYGDNGEFRHLSLSEIKDYILSYQKSTGRKVGCVVIDHIGALKKKGAKSGENQDLMDICHSMKAFAIETNTMLIMQSQAPREKAGIGDLELNKDAAFGTVFFESYCDYLITIWQPLKRCYSDSDCPTVTAYKFCKIRHKNVKKDEIQEDVRYRLYFDPNTETYRELTELETKSFEFWNNKATNKRKEDRKTDVLTYESMPWSKEAELKNGTVNNIENEATSKRTSPIH